MTQYHVDAAEITSASALAARSADDIRAQVVAMLGHLTALEATWQGGAAHAFADVLAEWRSAQHHVEAALDGITRALAGAASHYVEAEQTVARMFGR